jgi:hypothetical protein
MRDWSVVTVAEKSALWTLQATLSSRSTSQAVGRVREDCEETWRTMRDLTMPVRWFLGFPETSDAVMPAGGD